MKKRLLTIVIIVITALVFAACTRQNSSNRQVNERRPIVIDENDKTDFVIADYDDSIHQTEASEHTEEKSYELKENEIIFSYGQLIGGIVYQTYISNDVNVYILPCFNSRIKDRLNAGELVQIIGVSDDKEIFENNDDRWIKILYGVVLREGHWSFEDPEMGWILASYADVNKNVSYLEITEKKGIDNMGYPVLHGKYNLDGIVMEFSVSASKVENQDFYTFSWDYRNIYFHHSNKPGLYIWNEYQNELRHITYVGGEGSIWGFSIWSKVTDDFKYSLQDQGTSMPPRGVVVWDLESGEEIFSDRYYNVNLNGHTIEIVRRYNAFYSGEWHTRSPGFTDEEIIFAENFIEKNNPPENLVRHGAYTLHLVYAYNIETEEKKLISGQYILLE